MSVKLLRGDPLAISDNPLDHDLLPLLDNFIVKSGNKQFIVLHTYGSHFNYRDRYSDKFKVFIPDNSVNLEYRHRDLLINSYDNSILSTDDFLASVIDKLRNTGAVTCMFYLPDHGEDIMDDDRHRFLHASPCPTYYQLHIPFLIWFSDEYNNRYPRSDKKCCFASFVSYNYKSCVSYNARFRRHCHSSSRFGIFGCECRLLSS